MTVHAVIDASGDVVNRIVLAPGAPFDPPSGFSVVSLEGVSPEPGIGWRYVDDAFLPPVAPAIGLDALREAARASVESRRVAILSGGYQHNFGGSAGIRTLDNRNERDAITWLGLKGLVDAMVAAGDGGDLVSIRDAANGTFTASAATVSGALVGMAAWRAEVLSASWALKDAIAKAEDEADLSAIDFDLFWPE